MDTTPKFFVCMHCGNVVEKLHDTGVPVVCCGEAMHALVPGTVDAALEKHVPVCSVEGRLVHVKVGEVAHPMLEEHHIGWIWLQTKNGGQRAITWPGSEAKATFVLADGDEPLAAYEWCNLHGLWKADF